MKKKRGYVKKWEGRGSMANLLWKNKKLLKKWQKFLRNMPAAQYEKLFPDSGGWVKKFAEGILKKTKRKLSLAKGILQKNKRGKGRTKLRPLKMWQVCKAMKYLGEIRDFSMWACLFADQAFTKVSEEELQHLVPYMETEIKKFRDRYTWWPHPGVLLGIARKAKKQNWVEEKAEKRKEKEMKKREEKEKKNQRGTKRKAGKDEKKSCYRHVFWHPQSECWRALVKTTRNGRRLYEHFDNMKAAATRVSVALKIPLSELRKGGGEVVKETASLYQGVFYEKRCAYSQKWMAVIYVKRRGHQQLVWKTLGHFPTQILAAKAVAKAKGVKVSALRQKKKKIYDTRVARGLAMSRFTMLCQVFVNNFVKKNNNKGEEGPANPCDYEKSEMVMKSPKHRKMFKEESVMEAASTALKYGPSKDDLLQAWKETKHSMKYWGTLQRKLRHTGAMDADHRRLRIMMTLQLVAKKLHGKDCSFWVQNAGRFVSKHMGPVIFLSKCGVVEKKKEKNPVKKNVMKKVNIKKIKK